MLKIDCAVSGSFESPRSGEPIMYNLSIKCNLSVSTSL